MKPLEVQPRRQITTCIQMVDGSHLDVLGPCMHQVRNHRHAATETHLACPYCVAGTDRVFAIEQVTR